mmetsp:Transcript_20224/g.55811  ORF Transcript_20224/g.55811 Transcript_20224/m.55811 type:complete len:298 (-) Transcript_20224:1015-1908(-)
MTKPKCCISACNVSNSTCHSMSGASSAGNKAAATKTPPAALQAEAQEIQVLEDQANTWGHAKSSTIKTSAPCGKPPSMCSGPASLARHVKSSVELCLDAASRRSMAPAPNGTAYFAGTMPINGGGAGSSWGGPQTQASCAATTSGAQVVPSAPSSAASAVSSLPSPSTVSPGASSTTSLSSLPSSPSRSAPLLGVWPPGHRPAFSAAWSHIGPSLCSPALTPALVKCSIHACDVWLACAAPCNHARTELAMASSSALPCRPPNRKLPAEPPGACAAAAAPTTRNASRPMSTEGQPPE